MFEIYFCLYRGEVMITHYHTCTWLGLGTGRIIPFILFLSVARGGSQYLKT